MSNAKPSAKVENPRPPFKEMTAGQKMVYILQVVVCLCTFGFVFPNVIGTNDMQV